MEVDIPEEHSLSCLTSRDVEQIVGLLDPPSK